MILEGVGAISYERDTPVGSKEVWGKLLNSFDLQGGETLLWFRTEALSELLKEREREIDGDAWFLRECQTYSQGTRHRINLSFSWQIVHEGVLERSSTRSPNLLKFGE